MEIVRLYRIEKVMNFVAKYFVLCGLQDSSCEKGIPLRRIGKMKWFFLCELQNWGCGKAVHLYRIEIDGLGWGRRREERQGSLGWRWIGCGLLSAFSQIDLPLAARGMQMVVCVPEVAARRRAPRLERCGNPRESITEEVTRRSGDQ